MSEKSFKVIVPENYDPSKPIVIHLLEGQAPDPIKTVQEQSVKISGDIISPSEYSKLIAHTSGIFPTTDAIVEYSDNPKNPWIELKLNPSKSIHTTVIGKLAENKELEQFGFNVDGKFTNVTFIDFITKHAHCFAVAGVVKQLRKELKNFQAQFKTLVKKTDDSQGNTEDYIQTELDKTKANIPESIHLKMPLFEGQEPIEFIAEVEITVSMTSGKPEAKFGFFVLDLESIKREAAEEIIKEQIETLKEKFICIRVNNN